MRLTVLGSGDAFSGCGCNAGYLVDSRVLVDCGAPVHVLARRAQLPLRDLRVLLITHFHADHSFMLPVVLGACAQGLTPVDPGLVIAGPPGVREFTRRLLSTGYGAHIVALIEAAIQPRYVPLQDGDDVVLNGYRIRAHAVVHSLGPSLAYVVSDDDGVSVGFSGDSTPCAALDRVAVQSDAFVCECTGWDTRVPGGHLSGADVAELMARHPETRFILSHLSERRELDGAIIAHDLLTLDITSRERAPASPSA